MADIRRINKKYEPLEITEVEDLPPGWKFEIDGIVWDFERFAKWSNREDLAYWFSVFFWRNRNLNKNATRDMYWYSYARFWSFLDAYNLEIKKLNELDFKAILFFKNWLNAENLVNNKKNNNDKNILLSQGTKRHIFGSIRKTLQRLISYEAIDNKFVLPDVGFSNEKLHTKKTLPFTQLERIKIVDACKKEFELIDQDEITNYRQIYVPYILTLALRTGFNIQPILSLETDSIRNSILEGRIEILIKKNRGYSTQNVAFENSNDSKDIAYVSKKVGALIKALIGINERLRIYAPHDLQNKLFLVPTRTGEVRVLNPIELWVNIQRFRDKYNLTDDSGNPLEINIRRMRPTFAHSLLKINGGDIRHLQKSLNHKNIQTTMNYLDSNQEEFKSAFKFNGVVMQHKLSASNPISLAKEIGTSLKEAEKLLSGENSMTTSNCKNPLNSPFQKRGESHLPCSNFMSCFHCPNQVITIEDRYKVFSFYWWLMEKKNNMPPKAWKKNYEWIIKTIDEDISEKLGSPEEVAEIKLRAKDDPYPAWKILKNGWN